VILLNADLGESFGRYKLGMDEEVMPYIDMVNIACGFHAGDPVVMDKTVMLAKKHNVKIGAHPGYPDLMGFGRRSMKLTAKEVENYIIYQVGALRAFAAKHGVDVKYIKPHGALYNDMRDEEVLRGVLEAARVLGLDLVALSGLDIENVAKEYGVKVIYEVFADRNYDDNGFLLPRSMKNAVITDENEILKRILMFKEGYVLSVNSKVLKLKADTVCVHGDNEKAVELVKKIKEIL
jgi:UPF0271 protein